MVKTTTKKTKGAASVPNELAAPIGLPPALYAFVHSYAVYKVDRKPEDRIPQDLLMCAKQMKPLLDDKAVKKWMKKYLEGTKAKLAEHVIQGKSVRYVKVGGDGGKPLVANNMVKPLLAAMHQSAGCMNKTRIVEGFRANFATSRLDASTISQAAHEVNLACKVCAGVMRLPRKQHKEAISTFVFGERFQIDASEIAPDKAKHLRKLGFRYILTCVDCTSKWGWAWALKTLKVEETVNILIQLFDDEMVPDILHSDNGGQFRNKIIAALAATERFSQIFGASHTPQHQGQVERFNQTIKGHLIVWIRDNWDKADQWPFEGLDSTVKKYRDTPHQTIGMSPYLYRFGRLRTPKERRERSQEILALKRLLASNETMPDAGRFAPQGHDDSILLTNCLTAHLERRDQHHRMALTRTTKRQALNRDAAVNLRQSGVRLRPNVVPTIGCEVRFRRPVKNPTQFFAKNPTLAPNVVGTIVAASSVAGSFKVEWLDETKRPRTKWILPGEFITTNTEAHEIHVDPTMPWSDVKTYLRDFVDVVQQRWRNTRALVTELAQDPDIDRRSVDDVLNQMVLPDLLTVSSQEYSEKVVLNLLDSKFFLHLKDIAGARLGCPARELIEEDDIEETMKHLVQDLQFRDFMAASAKWRFMRLANPSQTYPLVIEALTGSEHSCRDCYLSGACSPEHLCCCDFATQSMVAMGWLQRTTAGRPELLPPEGKFSCKYCNII